MPLFDRIAAYLMSQTELVDVQSAGAPAAGQVLTASGPTAAFWNLPAGGVNPFIANVKATASTGMSSMTDVLLTDMFLAPGAGNFLLWFSCDVSNSNGAQSSIFSVYVNGVQVVGSERTRRASAASSQTALAMSIYVPGVLGGQVVDIRWRVTNNSGTVTNRELTLMRTA